MKRRWRWKEKHLPVRVPLGSRRDRAGSEPGERDVADPHRRNDSLEPARGRVAQVLEGLRWLVNEATKDCDATIINASLGADGIVGQLVRPFNQATEIPALATDKAALKEKLRAWLSKPVAAKS